MSRFNILSLDGGGLRGLFSAVLLARLERELKIRITDHFDLIVGTSTGGIIALGLALGLSPRELEAFYLNQGHLIFPPRRGPEWVQNAWHSWRHNIWRCKYEADALETALRAESAFGERLIGDCTVPVVIPTFSLQTNKVRLFKTRHHEAYRRDHAIEAWKVAMATSAAPAILPAFKGIEHERLVDGGLWANDPTLTGIVEAKSTFGVPLEDIRVLSLGTTYGVERNAEELDEAGLLRWAWKARIVNAMFAAQASGVSVISGRLLAPGHLYRINVALACSLPLDRLRPDDLSRAAADAALHHGPAVHKHFFPHSPRRRCVLEPIKTHP